MHTLTLDPPPGDDEPGIGGGEGGDPPPNNRTRRDTPLDAIDRILARARRTAPAPDVAFAPLGWD